MPSGYLGQSDPKGFQMQFSQYSIDTDKMPQIQQRTNNLDFTGVDYKTSVGNADVKASMETGLSNNFQGSTGLIRYHSAPSSFFSSLEEEENNNIISHYFSNNSSPPLQSRPKTMQQNQPSISMSHSGESKLAKNCVESNDYSKGSTHKLAFLNRKAVAAIREDLRNHHHLVAIPENGPEVSNDTFGASQMSLGIQAQVSQPGRQQIQSYQSNPDTHDSLIAGCSMSKSTLIRHSSSPAGLLPGSLGYADEEISCSMDLASSCGDIPAPNRVQSHMSCLQRNGSSSGLLSQCSTNMSVPGIGERLNMAMVGSFARNQAGKNSDDYSLGNGNVLQGYTSKSPVGSWDDATTPAEKYAAVQTGTSSAVRKRSIESNGKRIIQDLNSAVAHAQGETGNLGASAVIYVPNNLPRSISAELAMDDLLQDSVPCRLRAKRGCATHPRSIAERMRRTRISEGMRKLQELVPNSDKTTNISDMLDEAVLYLKVLQKQVQEFREKEAKCTCIHKPDCAFKS
ncbi:hypothetical protein SUGI_0367160 [Cryptomeria japonica]|nr:hypothetical protein SUGI_0367160 [Cryptomeria japonica]